MIMPPLKRIETAGATGGVAETVPPEAGETDGPGLAQDLVIGNHHRTGRGLGAVTVGEKGADLEAEAGTGGENERVEGAPRRRTLGG